ncbi:hypothetical protein [Dokdonella sp.]|uniref:hypothetical protein n=1 Tax=Dokdonella sp. TaxID=2291710 RepID=UPI00378453AB
MNKTALLLVVLLGTTASASALAQGASLRGAGLLALDTTESHANAVVEMIDSGGGSTGARALRGSDASPRARGDAERVAPVPDPLPEKLIGDPAAPAAATPKRPTYRWQSLVPGAIK